MSYTVPKTGNTEFDQEMLYFVKQLQLNVQYAEKTGNYDRLHQFIDATYSYFTTYHIDANNNFTLDKVTNTATSEQKGEAMEQFADQIRAAVPDLNEFLSSLGLTNTSTIMSNIKTYVADHYNDLVNDNASFEVGQTAHINVFTNDVDLAHMNVGTLKLIDPTTHQPAVNNTIVVKGEGTWTVDTAHPGEVVFTPEAGFKSSPTPVQYVVDNQTGAKALAPATITLDYHQPNTTTVNHAPVANDDAYSTPKFQFIHFNPLVNDTDADGDKLTVTAINGTTFADQDYQNIKVDNGYVGVYDRGASFNFVPDDYNYEGTTSFTYTVSDGKGGTSTATETVTVTHVNQEPVPQELWLENEVMENASVSGNVADKFVDPDNDPITVIGVKHDTMYGEKVTGNVGQTIQGEFGHLTMQADGNYTYIADTAAADALGTIIGSGWGQDHFGFTVSDGQGGTVTQDLYIKINAVNDLPVTVPDHYSTNQGATISINPAINDTDIDLDRLHVVSIAGQTVGTTEQTIAVDHGSVHVDANGQLTFTADANYFGTVNIPYAITDGVATDTPVSGNISIDVTNNHAPVANNDVDRVRDSGQSVDLYPTWNDTDADNNPLTITKINDVALTPGVAQEIKVDHGVVSVSNEGSMSFKFDANYDGNTSFNYTVSDGQGGVATATQTVNMDHVNSDPIIDWPRYEGQTISENYTAMGNVINNQRIFDRENDPISLTSVEFTAEDGTIITATPGQVIEGNYGHLTFNADGSYTYNADKADWLPDPLWDFAEVPENFTYTVSDDHGGTATGPLNFTVRGVNDAPVANPDHYAVNQGGAVVLNPTANDTDVDDKYVTLSSLAGNDISYTGVINDSGTPMYNEASFAVDHGTITIDKNGVITFTADANYQGTITLPYSLSDHNPWEEGKADSTITIDVGSQATTTAQAASVQSNAVDYAIYNNLENNALHINPDIAKVI